MSLSKLIFHDRLDFSKKESSSFFTKHASPTISPHFQLKRGQEEKKFTEQGIYELNLDHLDAWYKQGHKNDVQADHKNLKQNHPQLLHNRSHGKVEFKCGSSQKPASEFLPEPVGNDPSAEQSLSRQFSVTMSAISQILTPEYVDLLQRELEEQTAQP